MTVGFFHYITKRKQNKYRQMGLHQIQKHLHVTVYTQRVKNTTCGMEENLCKAYIL